MNRTFVIFSLFFISCAAYGQNGFVITSRGDSLVGKVSFLLPTENHEELQIKTGKKKQRLKAFNIRRAVVDDKEYHGVKLGNIYKFMRLVKPGYASIYKFRNANSFEFSTDFIIKKGSDGIEVPNLSFRKVMGSFVDDCPNVQAQINNKTFKRSDLHQIVDQYNQCVDAGEVYKTERIIATSSEEALLLTKIITEVNRISPGSELITLLKDIKSKVDANQVVPGYLVSALKDQSKDIKEIKSEVNDLLKIIGK